MTEQDKAVIERTGVVTEYRDNPDVPNFVVFKCPVCHRRSSAQKDEPYRCTCGATITIGKG